MNRQRLPPETSQQAAVAFRARTLPEGGAMTKTEAILLAWMIISLLVVMILLR